jgi:hypothetical protein
MGKISSRLESLVAGLLIALAALVFSASAMAEDSPEISQAEITGYQQDLGVSAQKAEENLVIQGQGDGIVEELERSQGKRYAGVWFDDVTGEFVVPVLTGTSSASIASALPDSLQNDFRTRQAQYSWTELLEGHERIDEALLPLLEGGQVQTSLDPRANAVVVTEIENTSSAERAQVQAAVEEAGVKAEIRQQAGQLDVITQACTTTDPRLCDKPLRGGTAITPACAGCPGTVGECSAGFKATSITTGYRYVLTAGHCAVGIPKWASEDSHQNWYPIGNVEGFQFPTHDWAKINATGSSWDTTPWPSEVAHFWEDQERSITAEGASYLGEYVCHSGNASGTTCGNVGELDKTLTVQEGTLYHETEFNDICSRGGDSGGPVFTGNTGVGIYSAVNHVTNVGGPCDARGYYIELTEATEAMGVTVAQAPVIRTYPGASALPIHGATLNGSVDPNGYATNYYFQYGPTTAYGSSSATQSAGSGWQPTSVSANLTGLTSSTTYHFRLVASSGAGTSYGQDQVFSTPQWDSNSELGFIRFNGSANTTFDGYVGYPGAPYYQGRAMWGETGYPKITDPQNIDTLALDTDGSGIDELGFVRFNGSGNTHIDYYSGPNYKNLNASCDTGYPKITDPQNIQTVGIDSNGDGVDELGFIRFNGSGNTHLDAYSGSCFKTLSSYCDTGYPKITDPQNVQAVPLDINRDGIDELGFVRFNGSGNTHIDYYSGPCYKNLSASCDTGYPKITDPQNVRAMAIDVDGNGTDELGFLRYNAASGKAHLDTYSGPCYKNLFSSGDTGYPATSNPENLEAVSVNWTTDPNPGAWYTDNLGGSVNSDPDLASWEYNRLDMFARGSAENGLWHKGWVNGWYPWEKVGGSEVLSSGPSAVSWEPGRLDMVARSSTGIRHWWFQNSSGTWNLAENFTGTFTSDPDIASWGPNRLDIFVRGSNNRLWHKAWSNGWFEWETIGTATLASGPGAVSWGPGRIDIVARASDNTIMHWWFDNSTGVWSGPENIGGNITSDPDISSWGPGRLDVFGRGADGTLQHKYYANGSWSGWESLGGSPASGPGAVSWAGNRVDVAARVANNTIEHWFWMDP